VARSATAAKPEFSMAKKPEVSQSKTGFTQNRKIFTFV
jgi:hypothetical protein